MNTHNIAAIHKRGLAVLAIATALSQMAAGPVAARHADPRDYEATYQTPQQRDGVLPAWSGHAGGVEAGFGDSGLSSMTGGPAGGLVDRN